MKIQDVIDMANARSSGYWEEEFAEQEWEDEGGLYDEDNEPLSLPKSLRERYKEMFSNALHAARRGEVQHNRSDSEEDERQDVYDSEAEDD